FSTEIVEAYFLSDPADERLAVRPESERPQSPRLVDGPLEFAGGRVPELPLALATRVGHRLISQVAPAVAGPVAAAAGGRLAVRRKGKGANPVAIPFQRLPQATAGHVPQPNRFVRAAAGELGAIGGEGERGDGGGLVGEPVTDLPGRKLPHQDLFVRPRR